MAQNSTVAHTTSSGQAQQLPEAAASVTARVVSTNGFHLLFTLRDTTGTELLKKFEEFEKAILAKGWQPEVEARRSGQKMFGSANGQSRQSAQLPNTTCAKCGAPATRKSGLRKDQTQWEGVFCSTGDESHKMWLN